MKFGKVAAFLVKLILICALSGGLAVAFNTARPKPYTFAELSHPQPPEILEITTDALVKDFSSGEYSFVDARSDMEYAMAHIPGAVNIPSWAVGDELAGLVALVDPDRPVIVYCDGLSCGKSLIVAKKLVEHGFKDVSVYTEGIDGWIGAGMDLEAN
jgi:rhodanese-related sulfurtransferase